ncbi:unnamed protein product [Cochlearia groenlandica]
MNRSVVFSLALASLFLGVVSAHDWNILNQLKGLGSSSSSIQNDVVSSKLSTNLKRYCESWRINVEVHNIRNFEVVPQECVSHIEKYMTSSQYDDDVERAVDEVILHLGSMCCNKNKCDDDGMDAWIFDIDDTLLSTIPYHKNNGFFGGEKLNTTQFENWIRKRKAPSVPHMVKLYHEIREKGIKIFLISSRKEYLRSATVDNLIKAGFYGWSNLLLRGLEDEQKEVKRYTSEKREWLMSLGYRVWGVMGDQWSSFEGCPLPKRTFKLPNSIYYVV